jgi:outer membrane protein assembly factor BamA
MTLALRTKTNLSSGKIPIYDRVYLGYSERIRGHFFEKFEGENMAIASVVFRMPLLPIRYFNLRDISYLSNLKFGISLGFFIDTGLTWFQQDKIRASMLQSGYGMGIHLHLPYVNLLRFELAFDEESRGELIVDLEVDI